MYRGARRAVDKGANGFVDEPERRPDATYAFTVVEDGSDDPAGRIRIYEGSGEAIDMGDEEIEEIVVHDPIGRDNQVYGLTDTGYERALRDLIERSEHMALA